ncbi:MAG: exopolyphosphatase [Shewanella sp.]|nr:exopolyphosphatase [Shewanella sp.]
MTVRFAAITLGSNSFNMLVAQFECDRPKVVAKYKRKVRLANGINADSELTLEAMTRGLDCLAMFAQKLEQHQISASHTKIIATATLRNVSNADAFNSQALAILGQKIEIISGDQEAELIYQGMFHTTEGEHRRLVIDIGGGSTEFIIGDGDKLLYKTSLPIGCVSYQQPYFAHFPHRQTDFDAVVTQVKCVLTPHLETLKSYGCHLAVGASGSVQTMMELLRHRGFDEVITLAFLKQVKTEILQQTCPTLDNIEGLTSERAPTLATGVAIMLALFELLDLSSINLSGGALREGVLHRLSQSIN